MRLAAALVSLGVLVLYGVLAAQTGSWSLTAPRGGAVTLGASLLLANVGIWLAARSERAPAQRFQLAAAGWIWLLVQSGSVLYILQADMP